MRALQAIGDLAARSRLADVRGHRAAMWQASIAPLYLPYISRISPLYLPSMSPLYLPCISPLADVRGHRAAVWQDAASTNS